jgi:hypothetical protein
MENSQNFADSQSMSSPANKVQHPLDSVLLKSEHNDNEMIKEDLDYNDDDGI